MRTLLLLLALPLALASACQRKQPAAAQEKPVAPTPSTPTVNDEIANRVRNTPFPLADLLAKEQTAQQNKQLSALRAAVSEMAWLDGEALLQRLQQSAVPTWGDLLALFAVSEEGQRLPCVWGAVPLPPNSPFADLEDQVSCFIPMERSANTDANGNPTGKTRLLGPEYVFTINRADHAVTLMAAGDELITEAFTRDLILSRLALSWLIAQDPQLAQQDAQGAKAHQEKIKSEQEFQSQRGDQLRPALDAINRWMDQEQGKRPPNLEILGRSGLIVSPTLLTWAEPGVVPTVDQPAKALLYFERPLLIASKGLAIVLAAPVPNADGSRTVATSSQILDIPDAEFQQAANQH